MPRQSHRSPVNEIQECPQGGAKAVEKVKRTKHFSISPERLQEIQEKTRDETL